MNTKNNFLQNYQFRIFILLIISILIDYVWLANTNLNIGWDQGYHLSNAFKMHNLYGFHNDNLSTLWNSLLKVTDSYRGPLTYFISSIFLKIFGISYINAFLSNHIFNLICLYSIYELGRIIFNKSIGFWAASIFTLSPFIFTQRTDYLIDLSLTSFCILTFLFFTKWFLSKNQLTIYPILSGLSFGLIFLVKPTGIALIIIPLLITIIRRFYLIKNRSLIIGEIIIFSSIFLLIIYPWFSKNWITILSSIINAWQWGQKYQEGLEISDIKSWFFYIIRIPNFIGKFSFWTLLTIFSYRFLFKSESIFTIKISKIINLFYFSYFLNVYFITSLMSTKEIRFFLPIFPIICIYFSLFLNSDSKARELFYKKILIFSLLISLILHQYSLGGNFFKIKDYNQLKPTNWIQKEIVEEIKKENKNFIATLAVLPDTKEINTFNLEAEGIKQGEYVAVRQLMSNKKTFHFDLENFDWFLIKSGDQGIMQNEARKLIENKLNDKNTFVTHKEWSLNDKSILKLIKRKYPTIIIQEIKCKNKSPIINIKRINNGLKLIVSGDGKNLDSSYLLLDIKSSKKEIKENISLANGMFHPYFDKNSCYIIEQNIPITFDSNFKINNKLDVDYLFLNNSNNKIYSDNIEIIDDQYMDAGLLTANKIKSVERLGLNLKLGKFDELFKLVGILNQSDPKQIYLKDAENIFKFRYKKDKNENYLYNILITQILQREIKKAKNTAEIIIKNEKIPNQNIYISKAAIELYLANINGAKKAINNAKLLENSEDNQDLINTLDKIINFF